MLENPFKTLWNSWKNTKSVEESRRLARARGRKVVTETKPPAEEPELQRSELEGGTSTVTMRVVVT